MTYPFERLSTLSIIEYTDSRVPTKPGPPIWTPNLDPNLDPIMDPLAMA